MTDVDSMLSRIGLMEDRAAVGDLVVRYAWGMDLVDPHLYGSTLADEVMVDFRGSGIEPRVWTRDEWTTFALSTLASLDAHQHLATNVLIELDGDRATGRSALFVQGYFAHAPGGSENVHHGTYEYEFARGEAGWRITSLTTHSAWTSGNPSLFPEAAAAKADA
jgi:hypothetical protein